MTQTNDDSVLFTDVLILSWFILCLRVFSSVEKIGRCRKIYSFYFQNCMFSTQAFMESKKKDTWGGGVGGCVRFLALETVETDKYLDL